MIAAIFVLIQVIIKCDVRSGGVENTHNTIRKATKGTKKGETGRLFVKYKNLSEGTLRSSLVMR